MSPLDYVMDTLGKRTTRLITLDSPMKAVDAATALALWMAGVASITGMAGDAIIEYIVEAMTSSAVQLNREDWHEALTPAIQRGMAQPVEFEKIKARAEEGWRLSLSRDPKGVIKPTVANLIKIFRHDPAWQGVLVWDQFVGMVGFAKPPPFDFDPSDIIGKNAADLETDSFFASDPAYRPTTNALTNSIEGLMIEWLSDNHGVDASQASVELAAATAAVYNRINPWRDYLDFCEKEWDKVVRVGKPGDSKDVILRDLFLTNPDDKEEQPWAADFLRLFILGIVARARCPGAMFQTVLTLEGPQGVFKSSAFRALLPHVSLHTDTRPTDIGNKDSLLQGIGKALFELQEVGSLLVSKEADIWKAWISSSTRHFRPPYERSMISYPRSDIVVATLNPKGPWLRDVTGGRRYMILKVSSKIDTLGINKLRRQLLGEAAAMHSAGVQYYPDEALETIIKEVAQQRIIPDVTGIHLEPELKKYGLWFVTMEDIFVKILKQTTDDMHQGLITQVNSGMTGLGWTYTRQRRIGSDGKEERPTGWLDPLKRFAIPGHDGSAPPVLGKYPFVRILKQGAA